MASVELVSNVAEPLLRPAAPTLPEAPDTWDLARTPSTTIPPRSVNWPRNVGGFVAASLLLHVAALAAVMHGLPSARLWELRLPQGHNSVALAASVASPRSEAEATMRLELPRTESNEEPLARREAELPAAAAAEFASAQVDARLPPPAEMVRGDVDEQPDRPDRPLASPPQRLNEAKRPRRDAVVSIESVASAPSPESSGVKKSAPPTVVVSVAPVYPPVALAAGMHGVVKLRVRVNARGEVVAASLYESSGFPLLDQAALDVIHRWRYSPPDGEVGVAAEFIDKITFEIARRPAR